MNEQKTIFLALVLFLFQCICPGWLMANEPKQSCWSIDTPQMGQGEYSNPAYGKLIFNIPSLWRSKLNRTARQINEVIVFAPQSGNSFKMFLDPLMNEKETIDFNDKDVVRLQVEHLGKQFITSTVEKNITLQELKGSDSTGYYFSITNKKKAKPFEWQCLMQGRMTVGTFYLQFTLLSQTQDAKEISAALEMLATVKYNMIE